MRRLLGWFASLFTLPVHLSEGYYCRIMLRRHAALRQRIFHLRSALVGEGKHDVAKDLLDILNSKY